MFDNFWDVEETIEQGMGFKLFSLPHLIEIFLAIAIAVAVSLIYRRQSEKGRAKMRIIIAILLVADELFKHAGLIFNGNWLPKYLPFHLCSINIFLICLHAVLKKKSNFLANFLYALCLPGALIAILTPTWQILPVMNFMHLHSYSVHVLLITYPLMLMMAGEMKRDYRYIPLILLLLIVMAIPLNFVNKAFGSNFLFLAFPPKGTPLVLFQQWFGNHIIGYLILVPVILILLYIPFRKPQYN